MALTKKMLLLTGLSYALAAPLAEAAPPSVAGTTWTLAGSFKGKVGVKCQVGPSFSVPIKSPKKVVLPATIAFEDDAEIPGDTEGTFIWTDEYFPQKQVTGHWEQNKGKLELSFDHWYDSPLGALAFAFAQVPGGFDFSQDGVSAHTDAFNVTKLTVSGTINGKGSKIKVAESLGFTFNASAAGYGGANSCNFQFKSLGRSYKGVPSAS
ncbi:hypothetical protein [Methylomicrobium lacus]|uniref:hypothetical protein n=1 Tax=Methylomicrobium lacus TaxID=136992 RepID=UPI00045E87D7|nr:hypothetical protein [Methylomicrobium lacus]